jgi:ABC-type lipoprotein export system ATPase subunit
MELIRSLCAEFGAALLLVTHDQRVLELFDDVRQLGEMNRAASE